MTSQPPHNKHKPNTDDVTNINHLSSELIATIITKLDVSSICSISSTSKSFRLSAQHSLKFIPNFHLIEIAAPIERLRRLLVPNEKMTSLKLDCRRLSEGSICSVLQPRLSELALRNCYRFSGKVLGEVGARCKDLRSLYVSSVADNRGHLHNVCDLEGLLRGCTQLEILLTKHILEAVSEHREIITVGVNDAFSDVAIA
ncbi:F-box/LRR-repeat protein 10 [Tanacetum coccineum]